MNLQNLTCLAKPSAICLLTLATTQGAHAFNLNFDNLDSYDSKETLSSPALDDSFGNLTSLLNIKEENVFSLINGVRNDLLTFYSNKNERVKASYSKGTYFLKYSSNW